MLHDNENEKKEETPKAGSEHSVHLLLLAFLNPFR
jgi:hypothetical protein